MSSVGDGSCAGCDARKAMSCSFVIPSDAMCASSFGEFLSASVIVCGSGAKRNLEMLVRKFTGSVVRETAPGALKFLNGSGMFVFPSV